MNGRFQVSTMLSLSPESTERLRVAVEKVKADGISGDFLCHVPLEGPPGSYWLEPAPWAPLRTRLLYHLGWFLRREGTSPKRPRKHYKVTRAGEP